MSLERWNGIWGAIIVLSEYSQPMIAYSRVLEEKGQSRLLSPAFGRVYINIDTAGSALIRTRRPWLRLMKIIN